MVTSIYPPNWKGREGQWFTNRLCKGRAVTSEDELISVNNNHDHEPNNIEVAVKKVVQEMKTRARSEKQLLFQRSMHRLNIFFTADPSSIKILTYNSRSRKTGVDEKGVAESSSRHKKRWSRTRNTPTECPLTMPAIVVPCTNTKCNALSLIYNLYLY